jgi:hypothetical protein
MNIAILESIQLLLFIIIREYQLRISFNKSEFIEIVRKRVILRKTKNLVKLIEKI